MAMIVSINQAADQLHIDDIGSVFRPLTAMIQAASAVALDYIEMAEEDFSTSDGYEYPYQLQAAVLLLVGDMYRYRDSGAPGYVGAFLPGPVRALLYPLKTWGIEST